MSLVLNLRQRNSLTECIGQIFNEMRDERRKRIEDSFEKDCFAKTILGLSYHPSIPSL